MKNKDFYQSLSTCLRTELNGLKEFLDSEAVEDRIQLGEKIHDLYFYADFFELMSTEQTETAREKIVNVLKSRGTSNEVIEIIINSIQIPLDEFIDKITCGSGDLKQEQFYVESDLIH